MNDAEGDLSDEQVQAFMQNIFIIPRWDGAKFSNIGFQFYIV